MNRSIVRTTGNTFKYLQTYKMRNFKMTDSSSLSRDRAEDNVLDKVKCIGDATDKYKCFRRE